jgi:hypothetical protein
MEYFSSSVQYGDFKGSISVDRSDRFDQTLKKLGVKIGDNETLLGIEITILEHYNEKAHDARVHFFIIDFDNYKVGQETGKWEGIRVVNSTLPFDQVFGFFGLFKQFSATMSKGQWEANHGCIEDKEFEVIEEIDLDDAPISNET